MKRTEGKVRKALDKFNMIQTGDKIAVGLSGGKDSLALLTLLANLRRYYPQKFDLVAITIDMHNGESDFSKITEYCNSLGVEHIILPSRLYELLFEVRKEHNPCSLCARLRRAMLAEEAKKLGCNKIALGHHADDFIETFFLSMFYESRLATFAPVTHLDRTGMIVIRPMLLVWESETRAIARNLPVFHNDCPADKNTQREFIKQMLKDLEPKIHQVHEHILSALTHPERNHLIKTDLIEISKKD